MATTTTDSTTTMEEIFSKEECQKILTNCLKGEDTVVTYLSHEFKSLAGDVEGYLSEHFSLVVSFIENGETKMKKFFVKAVLNDSGSFLTKFTEAMDVFLKESFMYTKFFPEMESQKYFKLIHPKCYLSKQNILVLEDISVDGYHPHERLKFFNEEQCKSTLKTLAHYHAYGILYEELRSKNGPLRLNKLFPAEFEDRFFGENSSSPTRSFLLSALKSILDLVEQIPEETFPNKEHFQKLLDRNFEDSTREDQFKDKFRLTCTHGDLWANNIMFKYSEHGEDGENGSEIIDCKLIDFQLLTYGMSGFDVELFFYGNTTASFRSEHKTKLLEYYYEIFSKVLANNDVQVSNILSYNDLEEMCLLRGPEAKVQAICDMSLLYLPEEVHQEAAENPDHFKTVLIDERSKYILDIYHKNETFRKIIDEELMDLLKILEAKEELLKMKHSYH